MPTLAEHVARVALAKFDSLPEKCKPRTLADGRREWTPMAAVVLAREGGAEDITCVSLATGTKCLPASALPRCKGLVLHDSHAEILALRGFNFWLLSEVQAIVQGPTYESEYLDVVAKEANLRNENVCNVPYIPPFQLKDDFTIHFFTTEAPCGDASMDLLMESFPSDLATPWPTHGDEGSDLQGRGHFSLLGHVRRKPARADAEASLSKSCTDKLAVKQFTSVLSFPADVFIRKSSNTYIRTLVVYSDQYHTSGYERAFGRSGRLLKLNTIGCFFAVEPLPADFPRFRFGKTQQSCGDLLQKNRKVSNLSMLYVNATGSRSSVVEVLINGVKQGYKQWDERSRKASVISRRELWALAQEISDFNCQDSFVEGTQQHMLLHCGGRRPIAELYIFATASYDEAKYSSIRESHRNRKRLATNALGNWIKNTGDGDWTWS